jgi:hypothetical protein
MSEGKVEIHLYDIYTRKKLHAYWFLHLMVKISRISDRERLQENVLKISGLIVRKKLHENIKINSI